MSNGKQHARIFAEDIDSIPELSDCAWRVYFYLRTRATPGNGFWTDYATLAGMMENSRIKHHRTTISRAITQLCDAELIKREGKTNRTRYLVINAEIDQECTKN